VYSQLDATLQATQQHVQACHGSGLLLLFLASCICALACMLFGAPEGCVVEGLQLQVEAIALQVQQQNTQSGNSIVEYATTERTRQRTKLSMQGRGWQESSSACANCKLSGISQGTTSGAD
jgi:hypothetical protein